MWEHISFSSEIAWENSGHSVSADFPEVRKIVDAGATSKTIKDYYYRFFLTVVTATAIINYLIGNFIIRV